LLVAGLLACGGSEPPPEEKETVTEADQLNPLHHNSVNYEMIEAMDVIPDSHDDAIEGMLERTEDTGQVTDTTNDMADGTSTGEGEAQTGSAADTIPGSINLEDDVDGQGQEQAQTQTGQ
jgi:hypothetical protein